ncbi:MAG: acyl carrier protein [Christensenellales bacterium]|jgi:acyl carrier protein
MATFERVKSALVSTLGCEADDVTLESSITEDLGADSLSVVELIMALEDEFGLSLPDEDVKDIKLVKDVVNLIESKQQ